MYSVDYSNPNNIKVREWRVVKEASYYVWLVPEYYYDQYISDDVSSETNKLHWYDSVKQGKYSRTRQCWPTEELAWESANRKTELWLYHAKRRLDDAGKVRASIMHKMGLDTSRLRKYYNDPYYKLGLGEDDVEH